MKYRIVLLSFSLSIFFVNCISGTKNNKSTIIMTNTISNTTIDSNAGVSNRDLTRTALYTHIMDEVTTQDYLLHTAWPATLETRSVHCNEGYQLEDWVNILRNSNDQWTLFTCSPKAGWTSGEVDYGKRYTEIISVDLLHSWIIQHNSFDYSYINRTDALLSRYRWTADNKYLYLYPTYYPGPDAFSYSYELRTLIHSLYRLNLITGEFELIIENKQYFDFSLSPNEQYLIFSEKDNSDNIHLRDLRNNHENIINLDENSFVTGAFIWNRAKNIVVIFIGYEKQNGGWYDDLSSITIIILDLENLQPKRILTKDPRIFIPSRCSTDNDYWIKDEELCLYSINSNLESYNKYYSINIETEVVTFLR
jgi:dipeptidyl aminopeptidase/acylaminoacyl peptidase